MMDVHTSDASERDAPSGPPSRFPPRLIRTRADADVSAWQEEDVALVIGADHALVQGRRTADGRRRRRRVVHVGPGAVSPHVAAAATAAAAGAAGPRGHLVAADQVLHLLARKEGRENKLELKTKCWKGSKNPVHDYTYSDH